MSCYKCHCPSTLPVGSHCDKMRTVRTPCNSTDFRYEGYCPGCTLRKTKYVYPRLGEGGQICVETYDVSTQCTGHIISDENFKVLLAQQAEQHRQRLEYVVAVEEDLIRKPHEKK
jgi:hypothetical protein